MAGENRGFRRISGAWGTLHLDGVPVFEVDSFEAVIEFQRSDVQIGIDIDSKLIGAAGSGNYVCKHVYSRGIAKVLSALKEGKDLRFTASVALNDPDAIRGQRERVNIGNMWVNNLPLTNFTRAEIVEKTYEFGFTPTDSDLAEGIY